MRRTKKQTMVSSSFAENKHERQYIALYTSMLTSPAWRELSAKQQQLYIYMRLSAWQRVKSDGIDEYKDLLLFAENNNNVKNNDISELFYFNDARWYNTATIKADTKHYKLYKNRSSFYSDVTALEDAGFIETLFKGKKTRTRCIYRFSDKWHKQT